MGVWGPGNLESDGALDELATRSGKVMKQAWALLRRRTSWEADEYDHDALFVVLETVLALDAAGLIDGTEVPADDAIARTMARWLVGWDAYMDELGCKDGYKPERRAVIEGTFARFRAVCDKRRR